MEYDYIVRSFSVLPLASLLAGCLLLAGCNKSEVIGDSSIKIQDIGKEHLESPIGDNVHCEIYSFIGDYLFKNQGARNVSKLVQSEIEISQSKEPLKPYLAEVGESEMSHVLSVCCDAHPWCYQITIYSSDGVSIAASYYKDDAKFNESNIYEQLGFLYPNAERLIRTERLTREKQNNNKSEKGAKYFKIVRAIYYRKDRGFAYFLSKKKDGDRIIGYISYIIRK